MRLFLQTVLSAFLLLCVLSPNGVSAQTQEQMVQTQQYFEATILSLSEENGQQSARVRVESGDQQGEERSVSILPDARSGEINYQQGDRVVVLQTLNGANQETAAYVVDTMRTNALLILTALFVLIVIVIGRFHGVLSIIGMIYSFVIIGRFVVPNIALGNDPVFISLIGGLLISPVTFYLSHGFNRKTTVAIAGTIFALAITGILSLVFIRLGSLSGATSDEALFVLTLVNQSIDLRDLLLAGMIIGSLGILDDITVSQAAIVQKLLNTSTHMTTREIFFHAMDVGKDHISSLVNTLILVYAGASLPLFMLFINSELSFSIAASTEIVATELIRMLVGSIGLILAVPVTTLLACTFLKK